MQSLERRELWELGERWTNDLPARSQRQATLGSLGVRHEPGQPKGQLSPRYLQFKIKHLVNPRVYERKEEIEIWRIIAEANQETQLWAGQVWD